MNTKFLPISVVVTVKNDEAGIARLMEALAGQTVGPDEVVVVRAGRGVYRSLKEFKGNVRVVSVGADCSRGRGRNVGIRMARNEVIAVTDAGCRPHKDWLENLVRCLETDKSYKDYKDYKEGERGEGDQKDRKEKGKTVVAGWYRAVAKTELQRVMAGFLVPMVEKDKREKEEKEQKDRKEKGKTQKDKRGEGNIPASRSIMFTKKAWEMVGGYPEEAVSGAEDLEFARRLARHPEVKMIYCPQAVVDWEAPARLEEFFRDIVKHTRGNVEVGYWPHLIKNFTVVLRWMVFLTFPWMIPIYLGIKIIKIINTIDGLRSHLAIRQGDTLNLNKVIKIINMAQIIIVQLAADGGLILGLILGILGKLGKLGGIRGEGKE